MEIRYTNKKANKDKGRLVETFPFYSIEYGTETTGAVYSSDKNCFNKSMQFAFKRSPSKIVDKDILFNRCVGHYKVDYQTCLYLYNKYILKEYRKLNI